MTRFARLAVAAFAIANLTGCNALEAAGLVGRAAPVVKNPRASAAPTQGNQMFDMYDADRNGVLTRAELLALPTGAPAGGYKPGQKEAEIDQAIAKADRNGDGVLDRAEFMAVFGGGGQGQAASQAPARSLRR